MPRKSAPKATKSTPKKKSTKSAAKVVKKMDNASYFSAVLFMVLAITLTIIILMNMDPLMY